MKDCVGDNWPDKQDNLDASPILDSGVWVGFNSDQGGVTRLVSSEEDLISDSDCNTPVEIITDVDARKNSRQCLLDPVLQVNNSNDTPNQVNNSRDDKNPVNNSRSYSSKKIQPPNSSNKPKESVTSLDENACASCNERVYITERLVVDKSLYHKQCFKCAKCRRILSLNNFASNCGRLFCKPHFLEMFRQTGKYDEMDSTPSEVANQNSQHSGHANETGAITNEQTPADDELPLPQITRNIVEKFRLLESAAGIESLLPRQLSSGQQNMKCYQTTNMQRNSVHFDDESTEDVTDELPTPGITKNLLSLWSNIESKSLVSSVRSASSSCGTPRKTNRNMFQMNNLSSQSVDIIRHDDLIEDSYPAPNTTKSLAAKFKGNAPVLQKQSSYSINRSSSINQNVNLHQSYSGADIISGSTQNDDWLQSRVFDPHQGSENNPISRSDVWRSESTNEIDELPEQGMTRNLVGLFKSMEANKKWSYQ